MDLTSAMNAALWAASHSCDPSTQNGAVLLNAKAHLKLCECNRFPEGVQTTPERWERPLKYRFIEHAERNVVFSAARRGLSTQGGTLVAVWAACADCARAIATAGVSRLVRLPHDTSHSKWDDDISIGDTILTEAGVEIVELSPEGLRVPALRRNGEVWTP